MGSVSLPANVASAALWCLLFVIMGTVFSLPAKAQNVVTRKGKFGIQAPDGSWKLPPNYDAITLHEARAGKFAIPNYYYEIDSAGMQWLMFVPSHAFEKAPVSNWFKPATPVSDTLFRHTVLINRESKLESFSLYLMRKNNKWGYVVGSEGGMLQSAIQYDSVSVAGTGDDQFQLHLYQQRAQGIAFITANTSRAYKGQPEAVVVPPNQVITKTNLLSVIPSRLFTMQQSQNGQWYLRKTSCYECRSAYELERKTKDSSYLITYENVKSIQVSVEEILLSFTLQNKYGYLHLNKLGELKQLSSARYDSLPILAAHDPGKSYHLNVEILRGYYKGKLIGNQEDTLVYANADKYDRKVNLGNGYSLMQKGQLRGLERNQKILLEPKYDWIQEIKTGLFIVRSGEAAGLYTDSGYVLPLAKRSLVHDFISPYLLVSDRSGFRMYDYHKQQFVAASLSDSMYFLSNQPIIALSKKGSLHLVHSKTGIPITTAGAQSIQPVYDGKHLMVKEQANTLIISPEGVVMLKRKADSVFMLQDHYAFKSGIICFREANKYYLFNLVATKDFPSQAGFDKFWFAGTHCVFEMPGKNLLLNNAGQHFWYKQVLLHDGLVLQGLSDTDNKLHLNNGKIHALLKGESFEKLVSKPNYYCTQYILTRKVGQGLIHEVTGRVIYPDAGIAKIKVEYTKIPNKMYDHRESISFERNAKPIAIAVFLSNDEIMYSDGFDPCIYCSGGYNTSTTVKKNPDMEVYGFGGYIAKDGSKHYGSYVKGTRDGGSTSTTTRTKCTKCGGSGGADKTKSLRWSKEKEQYF